MSADPFPDEAPSPAILAFLAHYADAWNARDTEAVLAFLSVPFVIATGSTSHFLEDEAAVREHVEDAFDHEEERGIHAVGFVDVNAMPLPDEAQRVSVRKQHKRDDGTVFEDYPASFTIEADAGAFHIVGMARPA